LLHDADAKNEDGSSYLDKMLEVLSNKDLQRITSWQNKNCSRNNPIPLLDEEEKESSCKSREESSSSKECKENLTDGIIENQISETIEENSAVDD
jgi:hypothetical protein